MSWEQLNESLGGIPDLGGGCHCVGKSDLFDIEDAAEPRAEAARFICTSCPALAACQNCVQKHLSLVRSPDPSCPLLCHFR